MTTATTSNGSQSDRIQLNIFKLVRLIHGTEEALDLVYRDGYEKLSELTADQRKASTLDGLTEGQKETLKWVVSLSAFGKYQMVRVQFGLLARRCTRDSPRSLLAKTRKQLMTLVE